MYFDIDDMSVESGMSATPLCVVALGNFDGVHIAHRRLLEETEDLAEKLSLKLGKEVVSAVFTFRGLKPAVGCITDFERKLSLIEACGIDRCYFADFEKVSDMTPAEFVSDVLLSRLHAVGAVCGFNFRFGRNAAGDASVLRDELLRHGISELAVLPPVIYNGIKVSSTAVRKAVADGNTELATALLGRPYAICGNIVHGRAVGRIMSCPTLNLMLDRENVAPRFGVYFARCLWGGKMLPSIVNVGVRPTFDGEYGESLPLCEIHLLGNVDAFPEVGDKVSVLFDKFCRPEIRFSSVDMLYRRIADDIESAENFYRNR